MSVRIPGTRRSGTFKRSIRAACLSPPLRIGVGYLIGGECPKTQTSNRMNTTYTIPERGEHNMMCQTSVSDEFSSSPGECPKSQTLNRTNAIYTAPQKDGHHRMCRAGVQSELSDSPGTGCCCQRHARYNKEDGCRRRIIITN